MNLYKECENKKDQILKEFDFESVLKIMKFMKYDYHNVSSPEMSILDLHDMVSELISRCSIHY